jgi:YegS/Rv2252/BmrU family lipid kinase
MDRKSPAPAGRIPVILNATAGRGYSPEKIDELARLFAEHGLEVDIQAASDGAEILEMARRAIAQRPAFVVAAGGDGTVSAVASCLKGTDVALAVLPMGTLNHFARDLGIPPEVPDAVKAIAHGRPVGIDLGEVNERPFINNASLGLYPDIVRDRQRQQRRLGRGKYWAMLWATLAVLRRSPFLKLSMEINGKPTRCRSPFVFVGNNDYVMEGFSIGTRSSLRDGCLSVYTTQRRTRMGLVRLAFRALFGRLHQADDFAITHASQIRIDSKRRYMVVATDGEVIAMETPLEFRVLPGALSVILAPRVA